MNSRVLDPEEWESKLKGTEAEELWPSLDPAMSEVLVVEDGAKVAGAWVLIKTVHAECIWVHPDYRGTFGVAKRLMRGMREIASRWGVTRVITGSVSPKVTDLILRFGGSPIPCMMFTLPIQAKMAGGVTEADLGRYFHSQLADLIQEDIHPEDAEHDRRVGMALRKAVRDSDPNRAESDYNAWASVAGYHPITFISWGTDGRLRADIGTAIIEVDRDYRVHVVEVLCHS